SIETVSVSFNGIPSIGRARGVTQGELLRQEQRAGVVPVSQLPRQQGQPGNVERSSTDESGEPEQDREDEELEDEEEAPHARGPEEIGVDDLGPQSSTSAYVGSAGLETQDIDVEAAVGRKHEDQDASADGAAAPRSPSADSTSSKREAESGLEGEPAKKHPKSDAKDDDIELPNAEAEGAAENGASNADSMDTDS
ncbi:unnamed protein product, partial [Clonostachys rosea]